MSFSNSDPNCLFTPIDLGAITILHRIVHAPTTRLRASPDESTSPMMLEHYAQRASKGGLIITESAHRPTTAEATTAPLASIRRPMWTDGAASPMPFMRRVR